MTKKTNSVHYYSSYCPIRAKHEGANTETNTGKTQKCVFSSLDNHMSATEMKMMQNFTKLFLIKSLSNNIPVYMYEAGCVDLKLLRNCPIRAKTRRGRIRREYPRKNHTSFIAHRKFTKKCSIDISCSKLCHHKRTKLEKKKKKISIPQLCI